MRKTQIENANLCNKFIEIQQKFIFQNCRELTDLTFNTNNDMSLLQYT